MAPRIIFVTNVIIAAALVFAAAVQTARGGCDEGCYVVDPTGGVEIPAPPRRPNGVVIATCGNCG